ncbi:hypothetical protein LSAT2_011236 [Lamellibrachia satsuma]|nr:hypothetical protein LSAT2_011236 [Lamellibrachia satsuma]
MVYNFIVRHLIGYIGQYMRVGSSNKCSVIDSSTTNFTMSIRWSGLDFAPRPLSNCRSCPAHNRLIVAARCSCTSVPWCTLRRPAR